MAIKYVLNPITGKLDAVQDLSEYAKLAISTTRLNLYNNLIANSTLIPQQWYLITDYRTEDLIRGTVLGTERYDAPIEQIYVQASSVNELYPTAYSKDYPDEILTFKQVVNPDVFVGVANQYGTDFYVYNEGGVDYGNTTVLSSTATTITFDMSALNIADLDALRGDITFNAYDGVSGIGCYFDITNWKDDWDVDVDGKTIIVLEGTQALISSGFTFTGIMTPDVGSYLEFSFASYVFYSEGNWNFTINNSTHLTMNLLTEFNDRIPNNFNLEITDPISVVSASLSDTNLNDDWSFNSSTGQITILDGTSGYLTAGFDLTNLIYYGSISGTFLQSIRDFYGLIINRKNLTLDLDIACDYRGTKFRRFYAIQNAWAAGVYNKGDVVVYNGIYYIFSGVTSTTVTPSTANSGWALLNDATSTTNMYPKDFSIASMTIPLDYTTYTDRDMFASSILSGVNKVTIKTSGTLDVCFLGSPVQNVNITATYPLTVRNSLSDSNLNVTAVSVIIAMFGGAGELRGGFINYVSYSNFTMINSSYIYTCNSQDLGVVSFSVFCGAVTSSRINYIGSCVFYGNITSSDINYMSVGIFKKPFTDNIVGKITLVYANSDFRQNQIFGKIEQCQFDSQVYSCTFNGTFYLSNFYNTGGYVARCQFESFQNNTLYTSMSDVKFRGSSTGNNLTSTSASISNCDFNNEFNNNTMTGAFSFINTIFNGRVEGISGASNLLISGCKFDGNIYNVVTNVGVNQNRIMYSTFRGFSTVILSNVVISNCNFNGEVYSLTFNGANPVTPLNILRNNFLGGINTATWSGDQLSDSTFGVNFNASTMAAGVTATFNVYPDNLSSHAIVTKTRRNYYTKDDVFSGFGVETPTSSVDTLSFGAHYVEATGVFTLQDGNYTVNCTANTFSVNLPTAVGRTGRIYNIKNTGTGVITVDPNGTQTIDGNLTLTLTQYDSVCIQSTGANWIVI